MGVTGNDVLASDVQTGRTDATQQTPMRGSGQVGELV